MKRGGDGSTNPGGNDTLKVSTSMATSPSHQCPRCKRKGFVRRDAAEEFKRFGLHPWQRKGGYPRMYSCVECDNKWEVEKAP